MLGFPVLHHLPEPVHWVGDAIQTAKTVYHCVHSVSSVICLFAFWTASDLASQFDYCLKGLCTKVTSQHQSPGFFVQRVLSVSHPQLQIALTFICSSHQPYPVEETIRIWAYIPHLPSFLPTDSGSSVRWVLFSFYMFLKMRLREVKWLPNLTWSPRDTACGIRSSEPVPSHSNAVCNLIHHLSFTAMYKSQAMLMKLLKKLSVISVTELKITVQMRTVLY